MPGYETRENWGEIRYRVREPGKYVSFRRQALGKGVSVIWGKTSDDKWEVQALRFKTASGWTIPKAKTWVSNHETLTKIEGLSKEEIQTIQKEGEFEMRIEEVTPKNVTELDKKELFKLRNQISLCYVPDFWEHAGLVLKEIDHRGYAKFTKVIDLAFTMRQKMKQLFDSMMTKVGEFQKFENNECIIMPTGLDSSEHFGHHFAFCTLDKGVSFIHCEECGLPAAYVFLKENANWTIEKCERWVLDKATPDPSHFDKAAVSPAYVSYRETGEDDYKIVMIIPGQEKIAREAERVEWLPYAGYYGVIALYVSDLARIVGAIFWKDNGWTRAKASTFMSEYLNSKTVRSTSPSGLRKEGEQSMSSGDFMKRLDSDGAQLKIFKIDKKEQIISSVVYEPNVIDTDGEFMRKEAIREAAFNWMLVYGGAFKEQHKTTLSRREAAVVETYLAPISFAVGSEVITEGTWVATTKVFSKRLWGKIESGEITAYSIGGRGVRRPFDSR